MFEFRHIKDIEIVGVPSGVIINLPADQAASPAAEDQTHPSPQ